MIIKVCSHHKTVKNAVDYVLREKNAKGEKRDLIDEMTDEKDREFLLYLANTEKFNSEVKKLKYFSAVLAFHENDKLNDTQREIILNDFKRVLTNNYRYDIPFIVVKHIEHGREHWHIIGLRYDLNTQKFYNPFPPKWQKKYIVFCQDAENKLMLQQATKNRTFNTYNKLEQQIQKQNEMFYNTYYKKHQIKNVIPAPPIIINKKTVEEVLNVDKRKKEIENVKHIHPSHIIDKLGLYKDVAISKSNYVLAKVPWRVDNHPSLNFFYDNEKGWKWKDMATQETGSNIDFLLKNGYTYKESMNFLRELHNDLQKQKDYNKTTLIDDTAMDVAVDNVTTVNKETLADVLRQANDSLRNFTTNNQTEKPKHYIEKELSDYDRQRLQQERKYEVIPPQIKSYECATFKGYGIKDINENVVLYTHQKEYRNLKVSDEMNITHINNFSNNTIVVEGIHDYIAMYQQYKNTANYIVLNSTVNTDKAINYIKKYCNYEKIYIATDNDPAGQQAKEKLLNALKSNGIQAEALDYGNYKDPDLAYRHKKEEQQRQQPESKYEKYAIRKEKILQRKLERQQKQQQQQKEQPEQQRDTKTRWRTL